MAELVKALEERRMTWPEKWKARYLAEGRAQGIEEGRAQVIEEARTQGVEEGRAQGIVEGRAQVRLETLKSLEEVVPTRFGVTAALAFGQQLEVARQAGVAQDREFIDAICQCVIMSENAEQFLAGLRSICPETAQEPSAGQAPTVSKTDRNQSGSAVS